MSTPTPIAIDRTIFFLENVSSIKEIALEGKTRRGIRVITTDGHEEIFDVHFDQLVAAVREACSRD